MFLSILASLILCAFADPETIFSRMPERHVRELDVIYWEHQLYDATWVHAQHQKHVTAAAEQLSQLMVEHNIPMEIIPGRIISRPVEERRDLPVNSRGGREPGAALHRCAQLWREQDPTWHTEDAMTNRLRFCSVPRAWPEWNKGWTAGVQGVAAGNVFVVTEMSALDSGVGIYPFIGSSHSSLLHEAIHTLGCSHGPALADCENIDSHVNMVMNGGCNGPQKLGRITAVFDPEKRLCMDGKCISLAPHHGGGGCAAGIRGKLARQIHVIGVKDCSANERDWRGYCVAQRDQKCTRHGGIGQFSRLDQCMDFFKERPHKCRSGNVFFQGNNQCRCCFAHTEFEHEEGFKIFNAYENFQPLNTDWESLSRINTPYRVPTYTQICDDCKCSGVGMENYGEEFTFDECVVRSAQSGKAFMSYNAATGGCISAFTCLHQEDLKCEPSRTSTGFTSYRYENADAPVEGAWTVCGNNMHCNEVVKETWLWETNNAVVQFRDGTSLNDQCAEFCDGQNFFAVWGHFRRNCACYDECDQAREFRASETIRGHKNIVFERKADYEVGNWGECSASCGEGVERRDVTCIHPHGCAGPAPVSERMCSRPMCTGQTVGWTCPVVGRSPGSFHSRTDVNNIQECKDLCEERLDDECKGIMFHGSENGPSGRCLVLKRDPFNNMQIRRQTQRIAARGDGLFCDDDENSD